MMRLVGSGLSGEVVLLAQMNVELDGAPLDWDLLDALLPRCVGGVAEHDESAAGVGVGDDNGSRDAFAALEDYAFAGHDLRDGDAGDDGGSGFAGGVAEVERDHAHTAFHVSPLAGHAAVSARGVVETVGGGAGVEVACVGSYDSLAEHGNL